MDETDIFNEIRNTGDAATLKKKKKGGGGEGGAAKKAHS